MLPKTPEADFKRDQNNPLFEAVMNSKVVHIEAYVVLIDMVLRNEVAYKLTNDTIDALIKHHKEVHCVDAKANTHDWADKEQQCKKLHEDFVQAINKFVFRTHVSALEGLEEEGAGELLCGKSEEVKNNISTLMKPLLPPPPRSVDAIRQLAPLLDPPADNMWCQPGMPGNLAAVESCGVLGAASSTDPNTSPLWALMTISDLSPTPASLKHTISFCSLPKLPFPNYPTLACWFLQNAAPAWGPLEWAVWTALGNRYRYARPSCDYQSLGRQLFNVDDV